MRIDISKYEKIYTFECEHITQLCGQNIQKKTYILESLRRYFSSYKYSEEINPGRDTVKIDGKEVGRKYFSVISISKQSDLISAIKLSKQSLMTEYLKQMLQDFEYQNYLRNIDEELEKLFIGLNEKMNDLGEVSLSYETSDIWAMVQSSKITGIRQDSIDDKDNFELVTIFFNLLTQVLKGAPKKLLVLIENIDHLLTMEEYKIFMSEVKRICEQYDIYFIVTLSLDGYVVMEQELFTGISIFGEEDFQMPEFNELLCYINNNYPCYKIFSEREILTLMEKIIQKIGRKKYLSTIEENVLCKLINQSFLLSDKEDCGGSSCELNFLKG